jgi:hypothetical protein
MQGGLPSVKMIMGTIVWLEHRLTSSLTFREAGLFLHDGLHCHQWLTPSTSSQLFTNHRCQGPPMDSLVEFLHLLTLVTQHASCPGVIGFEGRRLAQPFHVTPTRGRFLGLGLLAGLRRCYCYLSTRLSRDRLSRVWRALSP